ncbi:MAG: hypothetical protein ACR2JY_07330 [Chloroflexota bacterium]
MLIALAVRLIIPDTTAVSARRALRQAGLTELVELRREVCWGFEVGDAGAAQDVADRLLATDVLVNYNKHRGRWWAGELAAAQPPQPSVTRQWGALLVADRADPEPGQMQRLLTTRLGFHALRVRERATLWSIGVAGDEDANQVAQRAARLLLANPHGQVARLLTTGPSLDEGNVRPAVP